MSDTLGRLKGIVEFVSFFTEDALKKPFIKEELLARLRELERNLLLEVGEQQLNRETLSKVNEAVNRAGVHCAVYFWEAIDRVAQERDEARTEVAQMRPVYLAAMHWDSVWTTEDGGLAVMRLERVCREAKAKEPSHDE